MRRAHVVAEEGCRCRVGSLMSARPGVGERVWCWLETRARSERRGGLAASEGWNGVARLWRGLPVGARGWRSAGRAVEGGRAWVNLPGLRWD